MKICLLEPIGISKEILEKLAAPLRETGHEFIAYDTKATDVEELKKRSAGADIVMIANNPYPDEVVMAADSLKMIAVAFTGIDHVGQNACREKNVMICNCAGYSNQSVAELVIGMVIELLRKLRACDGAVRDGQTSAGLTGAEIAGKTVGIVGCGQIGLRCAKLFKAFGAEVLAYARKEHPEWKEEGIIAASLEELLAKSDIVSQHMPLNAETKGFFGKEQIDAMKDGAIFINCARGAIVDNQALADALNSGKLAAAGIDVFDMEPPIPEDYPLLHARNVLLTPHIAFATKESMMRRAEIEFGNVRAFLEGKPENICKF